MNGACEDYQYAPLSIICLVQWWLLTQITFFHQNTDKERKKITFALHLIPLYLFTYTYF